VELRISSRILCALAGAALLLVLPPARGILPAQTPSPWAQADGLAKTGMARLAAGDTQAAMEAFRAALKLDSANQQALAGLVGIRLKDGPDYDPKEAVALLRAAIGTQPARKDLRLIMGNTLMRLQQYDGALSEYQMALDLEVAPGIKGDIYLRIAEANRRKGNLEVAAAAAGRARQLLPGNVGATGMTALILDQIGDHAGAAKGYREVLQHDPANGVALNNLAWMLAQDGNVLEALPLAERAREVLPNAGNVLDTVGTVYMMLNRIDDAFAIFREIIDKDPSQAGHLSLALSAKGARDRVVETLNAALTNQPAPGKEQQIRKTLADLPPERQ
jgi:tetratricopeptide (TPR) repeat protein